MWWLDGPPSYLHNKGKKWLNTKKKTIEIKHSSDNKPYPKFGYGVLNIWHTK